MARQPLAAPESCTALLPIGQAAVTEELPCHAEINRPTPAKNTSRAQLRRIFAFMPSKHNANQRTWYMAAIAQKAELRNGGMGWRMTKRDG